MLGSDPNTVTDVSNLVPLPNKAQDVQSLHGTCTPPLHVPLNKPLLEKNPNSNGAHSRKYSVYKSIEWDSSGIKTSCLSETLIMMQKFGLISLQTLCEIVPQSIGIMMIGHLPHDPSKFLAAAGLARAFSNVLGASVAWGFTTGLFTLIPQALGQNRNDLVAIYAQRAFVVTFLIMIPLVVMQFFGGNFMCWIGEPCYLMNLTNNYCRVLIPYMFLLAWFCILKRILQSLNHNGALLVIILVGLVSSYPILYFVMYTCDLGYLGAAVGQIIVYIIQVFLAVMHLIRQGYGSIFVPQGLKTVCSKQGMKDYVNLSIPGLFQGSLEWWMIEIASVLSGYVKNSDVVIATTTVIANINLLCLGIALGSSIAISVRSGYYIGAGSIYYAQRSATIGFITGFIVSVAIAAGLVCWRDDIATIWTSDQETDDLVSKVMLVYCAMAVSMNCVQSMNGIYRSLGYQKVSGFCVVVGYYLISTPLALVLLFQQNWRDSKLWGCMAIWGCLTLGNMLSLTGAIFYMCFFMKWKRAIWSSQARIERG